MRSLILLLIFLSIISKIQGQIFFLDVNGVTIKCIECQDGDVGIVNDITYTAVDNSSLVDLVDQGSPDLDKVCTTLVTNMGALFSQESDFNQDISSWDVSNVVDMSDMFYLAESFNQPIGDWNVSNVTDMSSMFRAPGADGYSPFNQPIGGWDVSNVTDMSSMFSGADSFNQPVGDWDVSGVIDMSNMFNEAESFNQPIGGWDVSNVTLIYSMFQHALSFNQPIGDWDVSDVTFSGGMFLGAESFNQPIGGWDVSNVTNMMMMFSGAVSFNQDLNCWCVDQIFEPPVDFANDCPLFENFYPSWGECPDPDICQWELSTSELDQVFKGYPNPTREYFTLEISSSFSGARLEVFNAFGHSVHSTIAYGNRQDIDVRHLSPGIYIAMMSNGDTTRKVKMIVQ
jgi:surface protein